MEESEKVYIYTYNYIYIGAVCAVLSHVLRLFVTLWIIVHQAPLSMGFSRQEYWSGLFCPPPGDLPYLGIELKSLMSSALAGKFFTASATWKPCKMEYQEI